MLQSIKDFFKAVSVRWKAEVPLFFKTINKLANYLLGIAVGLQPDVVSFIDSWTKFGFHPIPIIEEISKYLIGASLGMKLVSKLTSLLSTMDADQIKAANPGELVLPSVTPKSDAQ